MIAQKKLQGVVTVLVFAGLIFLTGCGGAYNATGQYKRDILLNRIDKVRQSHEQAKKQFEVVLANYSRIIDANSGGIRKEYNKLDRERKRVQVVTDEILRRVKDVEAVGKPLFRNWEDELDKYENEAMRRSSEEQLDITRRNYLKLVHSIKATQRKIVYVQQSLNDQVLYLSHNLNTKALSEFKKEVIPIKVEVAELIKSMGKSINETKTFVNDNGSVILTTFEK
jgi:hypothetical protein